MSGLTIQSSITRDIPIRSNDLGIALCKAAGINPAIVTGIEIVIDSTDGFLYQENWIDATFHIAVDVDDSAIQQDVTALKNLLNPFVKDE